MTAWLESDRASLRHYLGYPAIFIQAEPRVEVAITSVLAIADGGTRPDNSTQLQILGWIQDLVTIESTLRTIWGAAVATKVGNIQIDVARAVATLRSEGRRLVNNISAAIGTTPKRDIFSSAQAETFGPPFPDIYDSGDPNVRW